MSFTSGSVSFRRFNVSGESPSAVDQDLLDKLASLVVQVKEGVAPEELAYGWSGGDHVFDNAFTFEKNVYERIVLFALRVDTNKVPGSIKRAYTLQEEAAVAKGNPSGFISKSQKREVKDTVAKMIDADLRSGKYLRRKIVPVMWDLDRSTVYMAGGGSAIALLIELFERTFGLVLEPLSAGMLAMRTVAVLGGRRDFEDARPTRFVFGPEGESQHPDYPWASKSADPKDFLGNEFLLWLWHRSEVKGGATLKSPEGDVTIMVDRSLDLECAYGQTGKDALRGDGPGRMPEARESLRIGKVPRKAGLVIEHGGNLFGLTLVADGMAVGSAKLPDVEDVDTARGVVEERLSMIGDLAGAIDILFREFVKARLGPDWKGATRKISEWIRQPLKAA